MKFSPGLFICGYNAPISRMITTKFRFNEFGVDEPFGRALKDFALMSQQHRYCPLKAKELQFSHQRPTTAPRVMVQYT